MHVDNNTFEKKVRPILQYVGTIGAIICSIAYIILVIVMITGFQYQNTTTTVLFAIVNAIVGLLIANLLRYQGISFAENLEANKAVKQEYYSLHTKDKKNHSLTYFWITHIIKDILTKGLTVCITTMGLIYIVIVGSNDWNLMLMAIVNLLLFICFGLLALDKSYDYYNTIYYNYMKEKIEEIKQWQSTLTEKTTETLKTKSAILPTNLKQEN